MTDLVHGAEGGELFYISSTSTWALIASKHVVPLSEDGCTGLSGWLSFVANNPSKKQSDGPNTRERIRNQAPHETRV